MARSFDISKQEVWNAYLSVKANKGAAGTDGETMEDFECNLKNNLYKIWNRLSSGSYFPPPVMRVEIPKSNGKTRNLGIPTISDRMAQTVIKDRLETIVEPSFHDDSYGYRPGKSALDEVAKARQRCWRDDWVLDMDMKGFFDVLDHDLVIKAVSKYTNCKWMQEEYPCIHFERYADDIVIHCRSYKQLKLIENKVKARLHKCKLELCSEKTKIVYCKDSNRKEKYPVCYL